MSKKKKTSGNKNLPAIRPTMLEPEDLPTMAAGLVHEVKNPLAAIHLHLQLLEGYADEIQEDQVKEKIQGKVSTIKNEILSLNQSLQDFIRLIRSEEKTGTIAIAFNELIKDIVGFLEPQALREGIELQFEPSEVDREIHMDPTFVKQIVMNLIINSIQAFEKSDIPMEERRITVSTGRKPPFDFVRIKDNGPGIPEDSQNRIFDPFYSTKEKGSGLGLSLVQRMITSMGGHLELRSEGQLGTEFTVYLGGPKMLSSKPN